MRYHRLLLLPLAALATLGTGLSRPAEAQGGVFTSLSVLAPLALPSSYTVTDLGTLGGSYSWENGTIIDLNSLLPSGSGWLIYGALGINDAGQIVGNGITNGQERACLLSPVP
jgi:hypothetical protein